MKLVSFRHPSGGVGVGAVVAEQVIDLTNLVDQCTGMRVQEPHVVDWLQHIPARSMLRLLGGGPAALAWIADELGRGERRLPAFALDQVHLLAPIPRPGKIVGVGKNYADHRAETGGASVEQPTLFFKAATTVVGPGTAVARPDVIRKMDYEGELGVVIGDFATRVRRENALDFVAGYTILNDISAREFQHDRTPRQTSLAKSIDGFCPIGPWIVTRDEVPDPQALELTLYLNGEEMQHGLTSDMIFPVGAIIEYITRYVTLEPGDIIATGTPAGIGAFRKPPVWLKGGDRVRIDISQIGSLEHTIV
jgi:2-keto-4-pentenoate hydratase/2-oxohepta-3-ene-1,7-dioic acid hydratase in catechol pathway